MRPRRPVWIPEEAPPLFPDPRDFDAEGLVAGGGDLSRARLLAAYRQGLFPWYNDPPILWWSPDPRAIVDPEHLHVSRSMRRVFRQAWSVRATWDLDEVLRGCAEREEGTWLHAEMHAAYAALGGSHDALAYEVRLDGQLVGGLYGVLIDGFFAAESKFHRARDASKIALIAAVTHLFARGVELFDVQFLTPHLQRLGVYEIDRGEYLERLVEATRRTEPPAERRAACPDVGEEIMPWLQEWLHSHAEFKAPRVG